MHNIFRLANAHTECQTTAISPAVGLCQYTEIWLYSVPCGLPAGEVVLKDQNSSTQFILTQVCREPADTLCKATPGITTLFY